MERVLPFNRRTKDRRSKRVDELKIPAAISAPSLSTERLREFGIGRV